MAVDLKPVNEYIKAVEKELAAGKVTEHTYRPALKKLLESLNPAVTATNEPQHITAVGAPDFRIVKNSLATGYVECKDIGTNLDATLKTDQLQRYLKSLHNLVLTNYLEFRWYVHGSLRLNIWLGDVQNNKVKPGKDGLEQTAELLDGFLKHEPEPINNPKELAQHMARLAHLMGFIIKNSLEGQIYAPSLHTQLIAFRQNLIPELSVEQFADMYAQTIAYGLFAARCETNKGKNFTRQSAAYLLPKTNPFLRKLFNHIAGPDLDEQLVGAVDDLAQILAQADMEAVLKGFGKSTGKDDPVVHFYETFLKEYDPKTREMRGVYYTPLPVVSYIVRSIDHILKTRFNKPQGFADPSVLVLDPAVGTATFLYVVMQEIHDAVIKQGQAGTWNDYVEEKLLPRLFGFELLMAPYAIAHLKLGLLLKETGYDVEKDKRLNIYLTNTLDEAVKKSEQLAGFNEYIVEEANAAADVKKTKSIMVVLGNPPYSGHSANKGDWAKQLVERYKTIDGKPLGEKNSKWLQDDYVKFLAFGQWRIERTGQGILSFITNHSYLDNPTFRGMRQSLLNNFTDIYILNLHGNSKKREVAPEGNRDENVFDIQQGVAISIFIKDKEKTRPATVHYADLWGARDGKYQVLLETGVNDTKWAKLTPTSPDYLFVARDETYLDEYMQGWKVTDLFPVNSVGLFTARDGLTIKWSGKEVEETISKFVAMPPEEARDKYNLGEDVRDWKVSLAQKDLRDSGLKSELVVPILYRPFDVRYTYYTGHSRGFHCMPRPDVMHHMIKQINLALCIGRAGQVVGSSHWDIVYCGRQILDLNIFYRGGGQYFPLYLYPKEGEMQFGKGRRPNLSLELIKTFSEKLGLKFVEDGKGDLKITFGPEDIFNYSYAILHSPTYRSRYDEFLKKDFPRLPLTSDKNLFKALVKKGAELVSLHLMESPLLNTFITSHHSEQGEHVVEKVSYDEKTKRVYINKTEYFGAVPTEVWNFQVGGYQVCEKWLKDRQKAHRKLTIDDVYHYQKIVVALKETIRLMAKIDVLIPGWPIE